MSSFAYFKLQGFKFIVYHVTIGNVEHIRLINQLIFTFCFLDFATCLMKGFHGLNFVYNP